jgi:hypothetical protein
MPVPGEFQSPVWAEAMAITAGIAAASIMRHGIAAHTSSVAKLCRKAVEAAGARRVLQIETNITTNTPAATSAHIPSITSRIRYTLLGAAMKSPAHPPSPLRETAADRFTAGAAAKSGGEQRARRARPAAGSFPPLREVGGDGAGAHKHDVWTKACGAGRERANEQRST